MDTRDYRSEITSMRKDRCRAALAASGAMLAQGLCRLGELRVRRAPKQHRLDPGLRLAVGQPLGIRSRLQNRGEACSRRAAELRGRIVGLKRQAQEVEAREGKLFTCSHCAAPCRTNLGGRLSQDEIGILGEAHPAAVAGWLCGTCYARHAAAVNLVCHCYANHHGVVRSRGIPGTRIVESRGVIRTGTEHGSVEAVKEALRQKSARMFANACVEFWWDEHRNTVLAGHSRNGNPYYRTRITYSGTATAVRVD